MAIGAEASVAVLLNEQPGNVLVPAIKAPNRINDGINMIHVAILVPNDSLAKGADVLIAPDLGCPLGGILRLPSVRSTTEGRLDEAGETAF